MQEIYYDIQLYQGSSLHQILFWKVQGIFLFFFYLESKLKAFSTYLYMSGWLVFNIYIWKE